jgi:hypothetical protein
MDGKRDQCDRFIARDCKAEENMSMMSEKAPKRPAKGQTGSSKRMRTPPSEHIGKIMRGREREKRTKYRKGSYM